MPLEFQTGLFSDKLAEGLGVTLREVLLGQDVGHADVGIEEVITLGFHDLLQILIGHRLAASGIGHVKGDLAEAVVKGGLQIGGVFQQLALHPPQADPLAQQAQKTEQNGSHIKGLGALLDHGHSAAHHRQSAHDVGRTLGRGGGFSVHVDTGIHPIGVGIVPGIDNIKQFHKGNPPENSDFVHTKWYRIQYNIKEALQQGPFPRETPTVLLSFTSKLCYNR